MGMENITDLMEKLHDETGLPVVLSLTLEDGQWVARVTEGGYVLCDRDGELFLRSSGDTIEEALKELNRRCA